MVAFFTLCIFVRDIHVVTFVVIAIYTMKIHIVHLTDTIFCRPNCQRRIEFCVKVRGGWRSSRTGSRKAKCKSILWLAFKSLPVSSLLYHLFYHFINFSGCCTEEAFHLFLLLPYSRQFCLIVAYRAFQVTRIHFPKVFANYIFIYRLYLRYHFLHQCIHGFAIGAGFAVIWYLLVSCIIEPFLVEQLMRKR